MNRYTIHILNPIPPDQRGLNGWNMSPTATAPETMWDSWRETTTARRLPARCADLVARGFVVERITP